MLLQQVKCVIWFIKELVITAREVDLAFNSASDSNCVALASAFP